MTELRKRVESLLRERRKVSAIKIVKSNTCRHLKVCKRYVEMIEAEIVQEQAHNEMFDYLDNLRDSGITNMFGAAPYLQNMFELDIKEARSVLTNWMATYTERHKAIQ